MLFRYSQWDGSQSIPPLDPDELLDLLSGDLLEEGDLRRALERLLMRGRDPREGGRMSGVRDLMDRLRQRREQQLNQYDLSSFMDEIGDRLQDVINKERGGIERQRDSARSDQNADASMQEMLDRLTQRKLEALDEMPADVAGRLQRLMDYEFMDQEAREDFQKLIDELRQKMLGDQFQRMQQAVQNMKPEDLAPLREMMRDLNQLLAKHVRGGATDEDFQEFMDKWGGFFPDDIDSIDDLVDYLEKQIEKMNSLLQSMPEEMRQQLEETMQALLRDDRLQVDMMQMAGLLEQITGRPLGRRYPFSGDQPVGLDEAMDLMGQLNDVDELERELRQAMRDMDFDNVDQDLMQRLLGDEAAASLEELRRMAKMLEEAGFAKRDGDDMSLTARAIRRIGERALRDLFAELRQDRVGQHDNRNRGASSEQTQDTKAWEFGDPFLVDIGTTMSNAVRRSGPGLPVALEPKDIEVHRTESLITSATVIAMDMSRSMFRNGAFQEAKRVTLALNTLIKTRYPRDFLDLVVFSYLAMRLDSDRLLQSDWVRWGGTNIEVALEKGREILSKHKSANRQIILITDWRPMPSYYGNWNSYGYTEDAIESVLREVKRCTQAGIRINTFMMDRDPTLMALAQSMMRINKGRVFFGAPGQIGRYVLVDYLRGKRKKI